MNETDFRSEATETACAGYAFENEEMSPSADCSEREPASTRPDGTPRRRRRQVLPVIALLILLGLFLTSCATQDGSVPSTIKVEVGSGNQPQDVVSGIQIIVLLTILSLAPAILMMMTSFVRIIIVLSFVRSALGVPQMPPNQVLLGLALFLTIFVMAPVWQQVNDTSLQPYLRGEIDQQKAYQVGIQPVRAFMFKQTREKDLSLFVSMAKLPRPRNQSEVPTHVLIPAFIISELKTAFQMGFVVFIPFLLIDMVVSSTLMSMGMMMLPPIVISLPFKLLLFVLVDGWHLIVRSLVGSFG